jgi:uncharacterized membrane protein YfhO
LTVVEGLAALQDSNGEGISSAQIVAYAPERVVVHTSSATPGVLVLADAFYPGWRASVDGEAAAIYPANVLFRAVPLPAGEHTVVFTFEPSSWRLGLAVAGLGLLLMAVLGLLASWGFRRRRDHAV